MSNIKSLTHILPLAIILLGLVSYNFMNAQWTAAPANPPASNAAAPVNIGTASQVKNGALGVNGLLINSSYPTIAFVDPKVGSRLLYLQPSSNRFYFLGDRNGDGAVVWADDRPEALSINLGTTTSQDFTYVSNQVRAAQYCDAAGLNCVTSSGVGGGTWGTWTNVTASRPGNTWHQNIQTKAIMVHFWTNSGAGASVATSSTGVGAVTVASPDGDSGEWGNGTFIVPPGHWYRIGSSVRTVSELVMPF